MKNDLTLKQQRFVQKWHETGNKTTAYRHAYDCKDMNDKSISVEVARLSKDSRVILGFNELQDRAKERNDATTDRAIREYSRIAFADIGELFNDDGTLKPLSEIPDNVRHAIASFKTSEDGRIEIKLHDKLKALDALARHLGIFREDNQQKIPAFDKESFNEQLRQNEEQKAKWRETEKQRIEKYGD